MTNTSLVVFMAAIIVVGVLGTSFVQDAEALKSKNTASGSTDICGLSLCSEYPGGKAAYEAEWVSMYITSIPTTEIADTTYAINEVKAPVSAHNADKEYPAKLDVFIHKFELDKISDDEALDGIKETHMGFVDLYITSNLIEAVDETISLIDAGKLSGGEAVEAVHLTAEPQNVNPEYIGALDEVLHKYELDGTSADDALAEITKIHEGFTGLYITSDVIEDVGIQLNIYDTGNVSVERAVHKIHEVIEDAELAAAAAMSDDGIPVMKELPLNHIDMPAGSGVPGCEEGDWCCMPDDLHVHVGDTVTWVNSDTLPHTVTSISYDGEIIGLDVPNGFDSGMMSGGDEWSHTFDVVGEYYYYCQLHPWMEGTVNVQ